MHKSIIVKRLLLLAISYFLLVSLAIVLDYLLHLLDFARVGRYLGIIGTVLMTGSFTYSLRKRKVIRVGSPKAMLQLHEILAWAGAAMILVHSGIHFNVLLPWLAAGTMMVVVASGHVGKFLLRQAREELRQKEKALAAQGLDRRDIERRLFWDSIAVNLMARWRAIHIPFVVIFITLAVFHIVSILMFWNWK
ncbi:MAG: hypothetical protein Q9P14_19345 [candidate division KSB1 bacterium]|nr:hypothetical protein [candidate division KSB1 bacterium]MDQ7063692.1 hypothetical protein [candidate division KSB1 bacterium]